VSLINTIKSYPAKKPGEKKAFVLCWFGGSIWQTRRLINVLRDVGIDVVAMDFSETVLSDGNPQLLPRLVEEVVMLAKGEAKKFRKPTLLIGISLGALISLNLLRRTEFFYEGVLITGGDIVKAAQRIYGQEVWHQSYDKLAEMWRDVNMYTEPQKLSGKRLLFVLSSKDKLIDTEDVRSEVKVQREAGNKIILIERHVFGHIGTIIEETILFPKTILGYIRQIGNPD